VGRDNQSRVRQAAKLARKKANKHSADRILIVSEGSKTEPLYFNEIRTSLRLPTANVCVLPSDYGTSPDQIVEYAKDLFLNGNPHTDIKSKSFEKVFVVFDRDEHQHYHKGLSLVKNYNNKFKNDLKINVSFEAFVSVPCFELWLLLHYQDLHVPTLHRDEILSKLKQHIPDYEKGKAGYYQKMKEDMVAATERAERISSTTVAEDGTELYTDIYKLVNTLMHLKI